MVKPSLLFIGAYLSHIRGSKGPSEHLALALHQQGYKVQTASHLENRLFRLMDVVWKIITSKSSIVIIDVYSGNAFHVAFLAAYAAKLRKKKVYLVLHGGGLLEFAQQHPKKIARLFSKATYIISPSKYLINGLKQYQINYIPNPIELKRFPYSRNRVKKYSILWVRAFTAIYHPEIAVKILAQLKPLFPEVTLTMIGSDRGLLKSIKNLADELGVSDRITFTGPVPNNELYMYYQTHHVFLNTTEKESFGVAMVEAASCGIPIVSNTVGEIPYLWQNNINAILVNANNTNDYVNAIASIFNNQEFEEILSKNALRNTQQFALEIILRYWNEILAPPEP
jgi:glycosyltransferase involved in cell wall biosynthesis